MVPLELAYAAIRMAIVRRSSVAGLLLALLVTCLSLGPIQASRAEGYRNEPLKSLFPFQPADRPMLPPG